ncbi:MAG: DNA repair protein RecN [Oscillospiraceae bacterium]|nr:DNA repair protein RecN [Oscillospiraceae bacterium]
MLLALHLENMAVIESVDIEFSPGFTVLTGETGAGKSIIVDAISAILGGRVSRDVVRTGAKSAEVHALFGGFSDEALDALSGIGVTPDEDGYLLLTRTILPDGRSSCRIGGKPSTASLLRESAPYLVNIHGQHDSQLLLNENAHLGYLDAYADDGALLAAYREKYRLYTDTRRALEDLDTDEAEKARRIDMLKFQISQLERAHLTPGEEDKLYARRTILANSEKLSNALGEAVGLLSGGDDEATGAVEAVEAAAAALRRVSHVSPDIEKAAQTLSELSYSLSDAAQEVEALFDGIEFSERELDAIESRLDLLTRLGRRYGPGVDAMLAYLEKSKAALSAIESADERRAELEGKLKAYYKDALACAQKLHDCRAEKGAALDREIRAQLAYLDMPRAVFQTVLRPCGTPGDELGPDGIDRASFLISVNAGETPKPLSRVASGGELSRIMLAIKNVLSSGDPVGTMVFDEIDTGISGRAAQKVARRIASLARTRQILCVTHLTQIAAMADNHFFIEKGEKDGRSYTSVTKLDTSARARELARISAGDSITKTALDAAMEMLLECEGYKRSLLSGENT